MGYRSLPVHRTIVAVDVEGFGDRRRTNRNQVAVRDGLYQAVQEAFDQAGISWIDQDHEDRGDGMFILVGSEVPKSLFVESLPSRLAAALRRHNEDHPGPEQIRLRMALHAGEVNYDEHGATAAAINLAFRLLESGTLKRLLADSPGTLAIITSSWFYEEVVQHSSIATAYSAVQVIVKETITTGWVCPPSSIGEFYDEPPGFFPSDVRNMLSRLYRSALDEPIIPAGDMPAGLAIPTLDAGYVDHRFRVAEIASPSELGDDLWWHEVPIADDVCHFLLTRLTSSNMAASLVILLGQPGSGKSVLARILAARLAEIGQLAVRVDLRQVPANADLQDQIVFAISAATGEKVQWRQFIKSVGRKLRVIIFDGFDELLQTTGAAHDDFLLRVKEFQEREARFGRNLSAVVTSRIAVTSRARIPFGAMTIRLEPFCREQITAWLATWGDANRESLAERGMKPLPVSTALRYQELAEQPLLLLMLALYDADANELQRRPVSLGRTELYERLLRDFARREVRKDYPAVADAHLEHAVEAELLRLSVVAFAMFNRRSQSVPEEGLDADFSSLLVDQEPYGPRTDKLPDRLTVAQLTVGRFFFIYESRAAHDNRHFRTYEFLHPTFGEFLVARLVVLLLARTCTTERSANSSSQDKDQGGMIHALLSFAALSSRLPVVSFVGDLLDRLDAQQRAAISEFLLLLHGRALFPYGESPYDSYQPLPLTVTTRHAAWSANLVLLAVLAMPEVTGSQLFPRELEPGMAWRTEAMLWRSQLTGYGWEGLFEVIALDRHLSGRHRDIRLSRNDGEFVPKDPDMNWNFSVRPSVETQKGVFNEQGHNALAMQRRINFAAVMTENIMAHALNPLVSTFPAVAYACVILEDGVVVSAAHALLSAIYAPYQDPAPGDSVYLMLARTACLLTQHSNLEGDHSYLKAALRVLISAVEQGLASRACLEPLAGLSGGAITEDTKLMELLHRLDSLLSDH
jgi:NACHT domain